MYSRLAEIQGCDLIGRKKCVELKFHHAIVRQWKELRWSQLTILYFSVRNRKTLLFLLVTVESATRQTTARVFDLPRQHICFYLEK